MERNLSFLISQSHGKPPSMLVSINSRIFLVNDFVWSRITESCSITQFFFSFAVTVIEWIG